MDHRGSWRSSSSSSSSVFVSHMPRGEASYGAGAGEDPRPELADVGRLARRMLHRAVSSARAEEMSLSRLLREHLGPGAADLPVVSGSWPPYDHVNVQAGLDAWLAQPGREHTLVGLTRFRHHDFGLADLLQSAPESFGPRMGSVETKALAAAPGGVTRRCVQCAICMAADSGSPIALLIRGPEEHGMMRGVSVQAACADEDRAQQTIDEIRRLSVEHNVFRGHVISFGDEVFGDGEGALLSFLERPHIDRSQVVLPQEILDGIERQVLGVARHAARLLASRQHLKRGILLHGVPGTGKTHTVRYLLGQLPGVTVVVLSGAALGMIAEACSVARSLQPSLVVVEDVDLIAEEREFQPGAHPLLFQLLNEMDGLGDDADVAFLLTTNRADLLEPALAQRPGRVDHAAELPVPDAGARRALIDLYKGNLVLDLANPDAVVARTEGVTASFIRELLRRAALVAADETPDGAADQPELPPSDDRSADSDQPAAEPLRVTDAHLNAALDQLLDSRNELTRVLLGDRAARREGGPAGVSAVIREPRG